MFGQGGESIICSAALPTCAWRLLRHWQGDIASGDQTPKGAAASDAAGYLLGKAGVPKHAIITALAGSPTPNLDAFVEALKVRPGGPRERSLQAQNACRILHALLC